MHILLSAEESEAFLVEELRRAWPAAIHRLVAPGVISTDAVLQPEAPPRLVFCRQLLGNATEVSAQSISAWSERVLESVLPVLPDDCPWLLHVAPHYGGENAGANRCRLIVEALREKLQKRRRRLLRAMGKVPEVFSEGHSLVQLILSGPESGWLSLMPGPLPYRLRPVVSPFVKGEIPIASDKAAPSRAFAKLVEAELRLGRRMARGETCVDLGASPGSWSYVALERGARVIAVDRAPLREDLMRNPALEFHKGDAFTFVPEAPVDWLVCDVIAAPERSIELVIDWARRGLARHFVVTIKFKGHDEYAALERLKHALPPLCDEFYLTRLCANKNEACAFGTVATGRPD